MWTTHRMKQLMNPLVQDDALQVRADLSRISYIRHSPSTDRQWLISNFPSSLTRNITSHSMENLAFHYSLLRQKMIILPVLITSLIHFSLRGAGECTFWTYGSERVNCERVSTVSILTSIVHRVMNIGNVWFCKILTLVAPNIMGRNSL